MGETLYSLAKMGFSKAKAKPVNQESGYTVNLP